MDVNSLIQRFVRRNSDRISFQNDLEKTVQTLVESNSLTVELDEPGEPDVLPALNKVKRKRSWNHTQGILFLSCIT